MQPFNVMTTSQLGCVMDCDPATRLKVGGGTPTNNDVKINSWLATASRTNPLKLILDGYTITNGIVIPPGGYVWIEGIGAGGSGVAVASGSNSHAIRNSSATVFDGGTPGTMGGFVHLSNFSIDGNRGDGTVGNSTTGDPRGVPNTYWYSDIDLASLSFVRIENMYVYDAPAYAIRLNNCSDWSIAHTTVINPHASMVGGQFNSDCIHVDGPYTDGRIDDCYLYNNNSDDAIALNTPEGFGGTGDRTSISNVTIGSAWVGIRIYGTSDGMVGSVVINNVTGTVGMTGILLGAPGTNVADCSGKTIVASNCHFTVTSGSNGSMLRFFNSAGDITLTDCTMRSPNTTLSWVRADNAATCSSVTINNGSIYRDIVGHATTTDLVSAGAAFAINRFTINGFRVVNEQGQSYAAIARLFSMTNVTIGALFIGALDSTNITALADTFTGLGNITGPGVLPSGFAIPDANMGNNSPYIGSGHSNNPCIKLSGTAHTLNYT